MTVEEEYKKAIKNNPELKKQLQGDPEKQKLYKEKIADALNAAGGCLEVNPVYCRTCIFSHGDPPRADKPEKGHCMIYTPESGHIKPRAVLFNGALCEYYTEEE